MVKCKVTSVEEPLCSIQIKNCRCEECMHIKEVVNKKIKGGL